MVKAVAVLGSSEGVTGTVYFSQDGNGPTTVTGTLAGLKPGHHGFHVHALGTLPMVACQLDHTLILIARSMVPPRMRIAMLVI
ncbi:hypothetical protein VIGAN_05144700 [Vigna angularis var. angularis]|uniref:Superoxide dismutase copper/zinc binding domain-containing protein n=1 Tax=Vigna angularis var. angularis TaxID=157739 RepID=A0A0S3S5A5_PHAAN|nr:hypothetical protein VIGAN_05144700 [Vigna angularis var. angularis]